MLYEPNDYQIFFFLFNALLSLQALQYTVVELFANFPRFTAFDDVSTGRSQIDND